MSGQNVVRFEGSLIAGPSASSCSGFPSAVVNATFSLTPSNKIATVSASHLKVVNSASAYVALDGIGDGETVTQGTFLYLHASTEMLIRCTFANGSDPDIVSVMVVSGLFAFEASASKYLKLLEAQGVGVVEYFASGNL